MMFSENECRELAAFFAKRFSEPSVRTMLAQQAGIKEDLDNDQPDRAWERLITAAQNRRKLPKLAILAAKTDAADQNLQAVCNLLGARSRIVRNRSVAAAARQQPLTATPPSWSPAAPPTRPPRRGGPVPPELSRAAPQRHQSAVPGAAQEPAPREARRHAAPRSEAPPAAPAQTHDPCPCGSPAAVRQLALARPHTCDTRRPLCAKNLRRGTQRKRRNATALLRELTHTLPITLEEGLE